MKTKVRKFLNKEKDISAWEIEERKRRYSVLMQQFPYMAKFIRRYKVQGPKGSGILDQKRKIVK